MKILGSHSGPTELEILGVRPGQHPPGKSDAISVRERLLYGFIRESPELGCLPGFPMAEVDMLRGELTSPTPNQPQQKNTEDDTE